MQMMDPIQMPLQQPAEETERNKTTNGRNKMDTSGGWCLWNSRQRLLEFCRDIPCLVEFTCTPLKFGKLFCCKLNIKLYSILKEYKSSARGKSEKEAKDRAAMTMVRKLFKRELIERFGEPAKGALSENVIPTASDLQIAKQKASAFLSDGNSLPPMVHTSSMSTSNLAEDNSLLPTGHASQTNNLTEDNSLPPAVHSPSTSNLAEDNSLLPVAHTSQTNNLAEDDSLPPAVDSPSTSMNISKEELTEKKTTPTAEVTSLLKKCLLIDDRESMEQTAEALIDMDVDDISAVINAFRQEVIEKEEEWEKTNGRKVMLANASVLLNTKFTPKFGKYLEPNKGLLDIMLLLAVSPAVRLSFNQHSGKESDLLYKICKSFDYSQDDALDDGDIEREMTSLMATILENVWSCMKSFPGTSFLALSPEAGLKKVMETLIVSEDCLHKAFDNRARWISRCLTCSYNEPDETERVGPFAFPHILKSFHPFSKDAFYRRRCPQCGTLRLRSNLLFEKLAPCFAMYFQGCFPVSWLGAYDFEVCGAKYKLTSFLSDTGVWLRKQRGWFPLNASKKGLKARWNKVRGNVRLMMWERMGAKELLQKPPTTNDVTANFLKPLIISEGTKVEQVNRSLKRGGSGRRKNTTITYPEPLDIPATNRQLPSSKEILAVCSIDKLTTYAQMVLDEPPKMVRRTKLIKRLMMMQEHDDSYNDVDDDDDDEDEIVCLESERSTRQTTKNRQPGDLCEDILFPPADFGESEEENEPRKKKKTPKESSGLFGWERPTMTGNIPLMTDKEIEEFKRSFANANNVARPKPDDIMADGHNNAAATATPTRQEEAETEENSQHRSCSPVGIRLARWSDSTDEDVPRSPVLTGVEEANVPEHAIIALPWVQPAPADGASTAGSSSSSDPIQPANSDYSLDNVLHALDSARAVSILHTPVGACVEVLEPTSSSVAPVHFRDRPDIFENNARLLRREGDGFKKGDGMNFAPYVFKNGSSARE